MPFVLGEVEVSILDCVWSQTNLIDGAVIADGDLTVLVNNFFYDIAGVHGKYTGSVLNAVVNNATNYVYLDMYAALVINTVGYPASGAHIRLARVITSGGFIVQILPERVLMTAATEGEVQLTKTIDWTDIAGGSMVIGIVPAGSVIASALLTVDVVFDGGTMIEVGSDAAHAEIMVITDNDPSVAEKYNVVSGLMCPVSKSVKAFFPGGSPTHGSATLTVFA